ncbi:hypothetical protein [Burkholderia cenocepacia]|nr:hypothetical protein [Burkholderia cenocepacia]
MRLMVEINAAEGGEDAVMLVDEQARILTKHIHNAGGIVRTVARAKG